MLKGEITLLPKLADAIGHGSGYSPSGKHTPPPVGKLPFDNKLATWQTEWMKLERYLRENEIKPSTFAAEIGVAPSTITRLIKGERSPRIDLILLIRDKTGGQVTIDDFIDHAPKAVAQGAAA